MASYIDTIANMLACHPRLFPTEAHARHHLFFLTGNGYDWVEGQLQDPHGLPDPAEVRARHAAFRASLGLHEDWPSEAPVTRLFPMSECSKLVTIPDDVQPDWLAAARAALLWGWVVRHTGEEARWLRQAAARLTQLEAAARHAQVEATRTLYIAFGSSRARTRANAALHRTLAWRCDVGPGAKRACAEVTEEEWRTLQAQPIPGISRCQRCRYE